MDTLQDYNNCLTYVRCAIEDNWPGLPAISLFSCVISSCKINGSCCLRLVELVKLNPWSSSRSLKLSIMMRGTPAFNIAVTTLTWYTWVELGRILPTGWCSLSYYSMLPLSSTLAHFFELASAYPVHAYATWCVAQLHSLVATFSRQAEQNNF